MRFDPSGPFTHTRVFDVHTRVLIAFQATLELIINVISNLQRLSLSRFGRQSYWCGNLIHTWKTKSLVV